MTAKVLAIAPDENTPGKKDATGAFHPEARAFVKLHGGYHWRFPIDRQPGDRLALTIAQLGEHADLAAVAFFCHGFRRGLQCGADLRNVGRFAWALRASLAPGAPVILYACDAARDADADRKDDTQAGPGGAGGFASVLSEALGPDHWVDAHATAAHTTINPHVRRFQGGGDGQWIVEPSDRVRFRRFHDLLRNDRDFRLTFSMRPIEWARERVG